MVTAVFQRMDNHVAAGFQHLFGFSTVHEAPRYDIRTADQFTGLPVNGDNDHYYAIPGEHFSVAENDAADVTHAQAIDIYIARGSLAGNLG